MGLSEKNQKPNRSRSKKMGGKRKTRSKRGGAKPKNVMFKNCESDLDCTLDNPECDTKNNICVQKFRFMGGKTRKKLKKKHS
jgi:hypothetical protein